MIKLNRKTTLNKLQALLFHVFLFNKLFRNVEILNVWIVNKLGNYTLVEKNFKYWSVWKFIHGLT